MPILTVKGHLDRYHVGNGMVYRWAVPIITALIAGITAGPVIGLLAAILAALVWPPLTNWWMTRRYLKLIEMQGQFLDDYDVCAVSPADFERMLMATWGETDPDKALLLDCKAMRKAKLIYPTKAKTATEKKERFEKEEERRRRLGFPSQTTRRDYAVDWPHYKPHFQHLKNGVKVENCWLCDQNNEEQNERLFQTMDRLEREEASKKAKNDAAPRK